MSIIILLPVTILIFFEFCFSLLFSSVFSFLPFFEYNSLISSLSRSEPYFFPFNNIRKDREEKSLIYELWAFCYKCLKEEIWVKRCEQVIELETLKEIKKKDKRNIINSSR
jgi:hypothetical protein